MTYHCSPAIPISGNEASKSHYVCSYLIARINLYEDLQKLLAQNEMEEGDTFTGKTFGIVTDAEKCYFLECSYNEGKLSFKLSEPVTVVYKDEDLQAKVEKVLKHIVCLFEDAQKLDSVLDVDKSREINQRVRLAGNLAGMGTSSTKSN
ncbi:9719_t:CDS:2 [Funneliformis geosporum]|nr:9719_t:CDS:2 [Funneliformis geosporum]